MGSSVASASTPLIRVAGITKRYGATEALVDVELAVTAGETIGVVGHNGAGKSTLMRVLAGLTRADSGLLVVGGQDLTARYSSEQARAAGIRIVSQELSLCPALRVYESAMVSQPELRGAAWWRAASRAVTGQLDRIFPGHGITAGRRVGDLSLAQRQMLEIAQASLPVVGEPRVLILDEPTSALGPRAAEQLFRHLERERGRGLCSILISHRLHEILRHTDRTVVMRDGRILACRPSSGLTRDEVIGLMGQVGDSSGRESPDRTAPGSSGDPVVTAHDLSTRDLHGVTISVGRGEIVGLAGLEGQGQQEVLYEIWRRCRRRSGPLRVRGAVAFVTGERQEAGVFPFWRLAQNLSISALSRVRRWGLLSREGERALADTWIRDLNIKATSGSALGSLSGGSQQKVLVARALASRASLVLLDDPFRGVDVGTKRQIQELMRAEAALGRSFLWYTTENEELERCDRAYLLHGGAVVEELRAGDIREDRIVAASFAGEARDGGAG